MTKKEVAVTAVALILCAVAVFAAACTQPLTVNDALNTLSAASSGVAVADVSVTVTDSSNTVIYSYPEEADVPAELQGVVSNLVPSMNGTSSFDYAPLNFTGLSVTEEGGVATLSGQISDVNAFLGTQNVMYSGATISATIDTSAMRATAVDISYTLAGSTSNFTITVNTVYNY